MDEKQSSSHALHRQLKLSPVTTKINLFRFLALVRLVLYALFFKYRLLHLGTHGSSSFWLTATICELSLAFSWLLLQSIRWFPIERETFPERLPHSLPPVDVFVTTADPSKEPLIITMNTVLSVLAMDYPDGKIACYLSDDAASYLTFWALVETSQFAKKWVPFCKTYEVEPRVPDMFFKSGGKKFKDGEEYEHAYDVIEKGYNAFKHVVGGIGAGKRFIPEDIVCLLEGLTQWPAPDSKNHGPIFKAILYNDTDLNSGAEAFPSLFYVSREKKPHYRHQFKAGAMNSLVRVSGVVTNSPFVLNLDCDTYVNNSKALRHAMCFFMDSELERHISFVQFPQRFHGVDQEDIYANRLKVTFDVLIAGMDGLQGPFYCGTGCVRKREALYGSIYDSQVASNIDTNLNGLCNGHFLMSYEHLRKRFGKSHIFASSVSNTYNPGIKLLEPHAQNIVDLISCDYEKDTQWGDEVGFIYGSTVEDLLTGLKEHSQGWKSVYCRPYPDAFIGCAPTNGPDAFRWRKRASTGLLEILFTRYSPFLFSRKNKGLKFLQRAAYLGICISPLRSVPLFIYSGLQAVSLIRATPLTPKVWDPSFAVFLLLFFALYLNSFISSRWVDIDVKAWWNEERMTTIADVSSSLFAVLEVLMKLLGLSETVFVVTPKKTEEEKTVEKGQSGSFMFDNSPFFITPTALAILNTIAVMVGISHVLKQGFPTINSLFGQIFSCCWVCFYLQPFLKGIIRRRSLQGIPAPTLLKAALLVGFILYGIA